MKRTIVLVVAVCQNSSAVDNSLVLVLCSNSLLNNKCLFQFVLQCMLLTTS